MKLSSALGLIDTPQDTGSVEIAVLYTGPELTPCALQAAANLGKGLNFQVVLIAVHIVPYPLQLGPLAIMEKHLDAELRRAAEASGLPVTARIAFARDLTEAFRQCVRP